MMIEFNNRLSVNKLGDPDSSESIRKRSENVKKIVQTSKYTSIQEINKLIKKLGLTTKSGHYD